MKKERNFQIILRKILDKMLEKHNVDLDYILKHTEIEGKPWYQYYTLTQKEFEEWKIWVMDYLKTTSLPKRSHESEFGWLNLMWGLKIQDDELQIDTEK